MSAATRPVYDRPAPGEGLTEGGDPWKTEPVASQDNSGIHSANEVQGGAADDLSFLLGWARTPERWREFLDAADGGAAALTEIQSAGGAQVGVAIVSATGALLSANSAGRSICDQRLGVVTSRGADYLLPANHEALGQARLALERRGGRQTIAKLTVRENDGPLFAYVCAARHLPAHLAAGFGSFGGEDLAVIFPPAETSDLVESLRGSFGLTPAESRLAGLMREGLSLQECADELAVSVNTARNQLRAIFEKMGVKRQVDLVRALSQLSSLAGLLPGGAEGEAQAAAMAGGALSSAPPLQTFRLRDGRKLAWRDYGARNGRPVLVCHQGLGASLFPRGTDSLARDLGLRLIAPARPGASLSDPHPRYSYAAVAEDMIALCDSLGAEQMQLASVLDGAPYALVAAAMLGARADRVIMAGPRPPDWRTKAPRDVAHPLLQVRRRLVANPWLAEVIYPMMQRRLTPSGIADLVRVGASATPVDAAYLAAHPDLLAYSIDYVTDGFVANAREIVDATKAGARTPNLDLSGLTAPVTVWLGEQDPMLRPEEVRAWLGPHVQDLRLFPDAGNFLPYQAWPEMLAWLAA